MIVNLTPHPIHIYGPRTPLVIEPGSPEAQHHFRFTIQPTGTVARINERPGPSRHRRGAEVLQNNGCLGIIDVEYGHISGLPAGRPETWFVVSLATALAVPGRMDLVSPYNQVRNPEGTVVGCRGLARPVREISSDVERVLRVEGVRS